MCGISTVIFSSAIVSQPIHFITYQTYMLMYEAFQYHCHSTSMILSAAVSETYVRVDVSICILSPSTLPSAPPPVSVTFVLSLFYHGHTLVTFLDFSLAQHCGYGQYLKLFEK